MKLRGLLARENGLHGPPEQMRRQRRLRLDGKFFLRAKRAAAGRQRDLHFFGGDVQRAGDLVLIERRALALRKNFHAFSLRDRQAGFGFEKSRLHGLRAGMSAR